MNRAVAPSTGMTSWNRSEEERTYSSEELVDIFKTLGKVSASTSAARFSDSLGLFPREPDGPRHVEEKVAPAAQNGRFDTFLSRADQNISSASAWKQRGTASHAVAPVSNSWRSSRLSAPKEPAQQRYAHASRAQETEEEDVVFQPPPGILKQEPKAVLKQFWYKDIQGTQHGPFHQRQMKVWYEGDHFPMELLIRVGCDGTFKPMIDHFKACDALFLDKVPHDVITSPEIVVGTTDTEGKRAVKDGDQAEKRGNKDASHKATPTAKTGAKAITKQDTSAAKQDESAHDDKVDSPQKASEQGSKNTKKKASSQPAPLNTKEVRGGALDAVPQSKTAPSPASDSVQDPSPVVEMDIANHKNISRDPFTKVKKKKGNKKATGTTPSVASPVPQSARVLPQRKASPSPPRQRPVPRAVPLNEFTQKAANSAPAAAATQRPSAWSAPKTKVDLMSIMEEEARKAANTKEDRMHQQNSMAARIGSAWGTKHQTVPFSSLLQEEAQSSQSVAAPAQTSQRPAVASAWGTVNGGKHGLEHIMAEQRKQPAVAPTSGWAAAVSGSTAPLTSSLPANQPKSQTTKPVSSTNRRTTSGASSGIANLVDDEDIWGDETTPSPSIAAAPKQEHDMFGGASMSRALESWCREQMKTLTGNDDITLMRYLMSTPSFEVQEYLEQYLGRSMKVAKFAESFVRQRSFDQGGRGGSADGGAKPKRKTRRGK